MKKVFFLGGMALALTVAFLVELGQINQSVEFVADILQEFGVMR